MGGNAHFSFKKKNKIKNNKNNNYGHYLSLPATKQVRKLIAKLLFKILST